MCYWIVATPTFSLIISEQLPSLDLNTLPHFFLDSPTLLSLILHQEAVFDVQSGRPLEPAFYTGFPAYHNLIYKIFQQSKILEEAELQAAQDAGEPQVSEAEWEVGEDEEGLGAWRIRRKTVRTSRHPCTG